MQINAHSAEIQDLAFSPHDDLLLATASDDQTARFLFSHHPQKKYILHIKRIELFPLLLEECFFAYIIST